MIEKIDKDFWLKVAECWVKTDDGILIPEDREVEAKKAASISDEDLNLYCDIANDEIDDILADLGLDD